MLRLECTLSVMSMSVIVEMAEHDGGAEATSDDVAPKDDLAAWDANPKFLVILT